MFKKSFILGAFLVALFLVVQPVNAAGWVAPTSSPTNDTFLGIDMFYSGSNSLGIIVGVNGKMYKSSDGGATWTAKNSGTSVLLYGVDVVDLNTAWAVGAGGKIIKTTNGGDTWTPQTSGVTTTLRNVSFRNTSEGYVVGLDGLVLYTANGGSLWTAASSTGAFDLYGVANGYYGGLYVAGQAGIISYSGNNGANWTAEATDLTTQLSSMAAKHNISDTPLGSFYTSSDLVAVGDSGVIAYRKIGIGGGDWTIVNSGGANLNSVELSGSSAGFAVGTLGTILKTSDSGASWTAQSSPITTHLKGVAIPSAVPLRAWAVGEYGKILRYDETAPAVPGNLTKTTADTDTTPTFTWSAANDQITNSVSAPVSKYKYSLDGGEYTDNSSNLTVTTTALANGSHTIAVQAVDAANNESELATLNFTISASDTTPPTVSTVTPTTATVNVAQTYSATYLDASGISNCKLWIDDHASTGSMTPTGDMFSGTATQSVPFPTIGLHTLQVKCTDTKNNTNTLPAATNITVAATDITPPETTITSGPSNTNITSATFAFSANEPATFKCSLDLGSFDVCASPKIYSNLLVGTHMFQVYAIDSAGNPDLTQESYTWTIISGAVADTTPPTGSVLISGGVSAVKSTAVTLVLSCVDDISGCDQMSLSNNNTNWTPWENYSSPKSWTLLTGDGDKTVYALFKDVKGNLSLIYTDTIVLDTIPPDTAIVLKPPLSTTMTSAEFTWNKVGTEQYQVTYDYKIDAQQDWYNIIAPGLTYGILGVGSHTFSVRTKDIAGNVDLTPATYTWIITSGGQQAAADNTPPTGTLSISGGALAVKSTAVTLTPACVDDISGCSKMRFSDNGTSWTEWEAYGVSKTWTLVGGDGVKYAYVQFKDVKDNVSTATISDSIILDTVAPSVWAIIPTTATAGYAQSYTTTYYDPGLLAISGCDFYVDSINQGAMTTSGPNSGTASRSYAFAQSGNYSVQARCYDNASNIGYGQVTVVNVSSPSQGGGSSVDFTPPAAPTGVTRSTAESNNTPTFIWNVASDNIGVINYSVKVDGENWTNVNNVLMHTSGVLSDGSHAFYVRAHDAAGNVSSVASLAFTIKTTTGGSGATPAVTVKTQPPFSLEQMAADAQLVASGDLASLMSGAGITTCQMNITTAETKVASVFGAVASSTVKSAIINFTACGTVSTLHLGAGERLGVINSYKSAFGKLPSAISEWNDVTKIANGRFPGETSGTAEDGAMIRFKKIYKRNPNMDQQNDKAAVNVMAYGLRPLPRNMNSETAAIKIFKAIFKYAPSSATDWDAVRAIAYSGAKQ